MTKKEFDNVIIQIKHLLGTCVMSENEKNRKAFGISIANKLDEIEKYFDKLSESIDKSIDSLAASAKLIQEQNDWIYCLQTAAEYEDEKIMHEALLILKAIKNYKKGDKK